MAKARNNSAITVKERAEYAVVMAVLGPLALLPHRWRVPLAGAVVANVAAPLLGWRKRIGAHLDLALPELDSSERQRLLRSVPDNMGRLFIELFNPQDMRPIAAAASFSGGGVAALDAAMVEGRAVVCVSGHFGNYDVFRSALVQRGFDVGALYRPMNNRLFNARYERAIFAVGGRMFARGRRGFAHMVQHLRDGKLLALLIDQHMSRGARLSFFGQPANTAVSAAQMALKYDAVLVPIYAVRQADGLSFAIEVEEPVPHSDDETMTQALNDSLERQVRRHPEQWLWTHRRWKALAQGRPSQEDVEEDQI
ncbi:MAG: lysophospholipid acyltransferase family protein [Octadecabacter sp.]|nr:lysophospholipid acyltransferase family protein [Octadecabacter sp.]